MGSENNLKSLDFLLYALSEMRSSVQGVSGNALMSIAVCYWPIQTNALLSSGLSAAESVG